MIFQKRAQLAIKPPLPSPLGSLGSPVEEKESSIWIHSTIGHLPWQYWLLMSIQYCLDLLWRSLCMNNDRLLLRVLQKFTECWHSASKTLKLDRQDQVHDQRTSGKSINETTWTVLYLRILKDEIIKQTRRWTWTFQDSFYSILLCAGASMYT